jgi:DNA-binding transcriptional MerR regulator
MQKTADAFRTISEVAQDLDLPQHVLRFWETRFTQIKPLKRGGGRRYYRREDIELLRAIRQLLYGEGYTIKGVQKILKEQGARGVVAVGRREPTAYDALPDAAGEPADYAGEGEPEQGRSAESSVRGPAEYEVLEQLLTELGECERLLGAARAS